MFWKPKLCQKFLITQVTPGSKEERHIVEYPFFLKKSKDMFFYEGDNHSIPALCGDTQWMPYLTRDAVFVHYTARPEMLPKSSSLITIERGKPSERIVGDFGYCQMCSEIYKAEAKKNVWS